MLVHDHDHVFGFNFIVPCSMQVAAGGPALGANQQTKAVPVAYLVERNARILSCAGMPDCTWCDDFGSEPQERRPAPAIPGTCACLEDARIRFQPRPRCLRSVPVPREQCPVVNGARTPVYFGPFYDDWRAFRWESPRTD